MNDDVKHCPLCADTLHSVEVRNALSRIDNATYICSRCGQVEALQIRNPSADRPREVFYFDEVGGIMLVTENEPGYRPLFPHPVAGVDWCQRYVDTANDRFGYSPSTVRAVVSSSMAAQGLGH